MTTESTQWLKDERVETKRKYVHPKYINPLIDGHTEKKFDLLFYALQITNICAFLGTGIAISMVIHPAIENEGIRMLANLAVGWAMGSVLMMILNHRSRMRN